MIQTLYQEKQLLKTTLDDGGTSSLPRRLLHFSVDEVFRPTSATVLGSSVVVLVDPAADDACSPVGHVEIVYYSSKSCHITHHLFSSSVLVTLFWCCCSARRCLLSRALRRARRLLRAREVSEIMECRLGGYHDAKKDKSL